MCSTEKAEGKSQQTVMLRRFVVTLLFLLSFASFFVFVVGREEDCVDYFGNAVSHGHLYVPGPSVCSKCVCYHSNALFCKAIHCNPPYFCKKFRIGERCCEFDCLDSAEEISREKERLKKRRRFLGIYYSGSSWSKKPALLTSVLFTTIILIF